MAQAFPDATFVGYDYHAPSIEIARRHAGEAGIANASFEVADAGDYNGDGFDLIAFFDCLHDMADPLGSAQHPRPALGSEERRGGKEWVRTCRSRGAPHH